MSDLNLEENEPKQNEILDTVNDLLNQLTIHETDSGDEDNDSEEESKILEEATIDAVINYIKEKKCHNIITLAGAGISTAAGIPDFRSPGSGLYNNLQKYNLPHPMAIFELRYFKKNPKPFFTLAKEIYPTCFKPTISHYFVKLLVEKGLLLRHYTQNIDTLERIAGIPDEKIVEAHGTFHKGHCLKCYKEYCQEWLKDRVLANRIPICENCQGVVKPDIVFFGENLPEKFHRLLPEDFNRCDLLIIMGSSLTVYPVASLIDEVPITCPRLLINREKVGEVSFDDSDQYNEGLNFSCRTNRDVVLLGECDEGCKIIAEKLGWSEELMKMYEEGHKLLDMKKTEINKEQINEKPKM